MDGQASNFRIRTCDALQAEPALQTSADPTSNALHGPGSAARFQILAFENSIILPETLRVSDRINE